MKPLSTGHTRNKDDDVAQSTLAIAEPSHRSFDEAVADRVNTLLEGSYLGFSMSYEIGKIYALQIHGTTGPIDMTLKLASVSTDSSLTKRNISIFTFVTSDHRSSYIVIPDGKNGALIYRKGREERKGIPVESIRKAVVPVHP